MRTYFECIPCFVRQTFETIKRMTPDKAIHEKALRELLRAISEMDFKQAPPVMGQWIHRLIRELTQNEDPYLRDKENSNRFALSLYPERKKKIDSSENPQETAVRLAIAGNIIDLGAKHQLDDASVHASIEQALTAPLADGILNEFWEAVKQARNILYLGDNAGEIVFDRLLLEHMPREKITFAVRGKPAINDALMADAEAAGITDLVEVIDNGSDGPGTILETCSDEFCRRFEVADLVLAKGQGNYETLNDIPKDIFFMLKVKCPVIAEDIGCKVGAMILQRSALSMSAAEKEPHHPISCNIQPI